MKKLLSSKLGLSGTVFNKKKKKKYSIKYKYKLLGKCKFIFLLKTKKSTLGGLLFYLKK